MFFVFHVSKAHWRPRRGNYKPQSESLNNQWRQMCLGLVWTVGRLILTFIWVNDETNSTKRFSLWMKFSIRFPTCHHRIHRTLYVLLCCTEGDTDQLPRVWTSDLKVEDHWSWISACPVNKLTALQQHYNSSDLRRFKGCDNLQLYCRWSEAEWKRLRF